MVKFSSDGEVEELSREIWDEAKDIPVASMRFDTNGVLLADVANAGVSRRAVGQRSGNAAHDTRSGKFAPTGGKPAKKTRAPANVDPAEYARMYDAVRVAARMFAGNITEENLQSFIKKIAANPATVNLQNFASMVQQQQRNDLVDVLVGRQFKGPKLQAPRGYIQKVLAGISDDDVTEIMDRLEKLGKKPQDVDKLIRGKVPKERQEKVLALREKAKAKAEAKKET